jgi:mycofactocin precursor
MHDVETGITTTAVTEPKPEPIAATAPRPADELVEADLLVEDVSIDGMCGVY